MPLRLEIKRKFIQRSERVKFVDLHPTEPWILASLYAGTVCIWDYQSHTMVKSFEVTDLPDFPQDMTVYVPGFLVVLRMTPTSCHVQAQARIDIQSRKDLGYLYQKGLRRVAVPCDQGIPVVKIVC
ncbi:hypothetical protein NL676_006972 [Syzygium grande]|nr:hypothetical protein NL676_006972 [Syzygium grande]